MIKRLLYSVVMTLVAFTAFGHTTQQITHDENQYTEYQSISPEAARAVDSLSIILGNVNGIILSQQLRSILDADVDIAQVTKTINQMFNCQEGKDFITGKGLGLMVAQINQEFKNNHGCDLNKQLLLEHLKAELLTENPIDDHTAYAMGIKISDFWEQINSNGEDLSNALIDSLSSTIGTVNGSKMRNYLEMTDADFEQIFKGFEYGFEQEVDNISLVCEQAGIQIVQSFDYFQWQARMPLNKGLFMEHLTRGLYVEAFDEEEYLTLYEKIDPLIERVAGLSPDGIANKKAGEAYMEQLRKDKSFKFTKSGLAYKMLKEGKGKISTEDDVVNYVGKHLDGTVFDSREGEHMPPTIEIGIEGFSEMLQLMKPGDKAIVVIPSNLAYGAIPINDAIGPNETLIFEIEIIDRQK
ncbi:MAG: FKBP-type peptidyl-prolyl cis-trans isomerase [Muribaculaceae bacterium]|jgi:hypothetical protein|nr:FKBP-type peptidyl-prolyl cis-trans isomerase [Muribaculaceae bacterium]